MPEEKKEHFVLVPLSLAMKEARSSRAMKQIVSKYLSENKLPGSQRNFPVNFNHNKEYELEEKKKAADKLQKEIKETEKLSVPEQLKSAKAKDVSSDKKRS